MFTQSIYLRFYYDLSHLLRLIIFDKILSWVIKQIFQISISSVQHNLFFGKNPLTFINPNFYQILTWQCTSISESFFYFGVLNSFSFLRKPENIDFPSDIILYFVTGPVSQITYLHRYCQDFLVCFKVLTWCNDALRTTNGAL